MLVARVNFQLRHEHAVQTVFWDHYLDSVSDQTLGVFGPDLGHRGVFFAAPPTGVGHILFVRLFFAGQADFLRVDHDHEIPGIEVFRKNRLVFTT